MAVLTGINAGLAQGAQQQAENQAQINAELERQRQAQAAANEQAEQQQEQRRQTAAQQQQAQATQARITFQDQCIDVKFPSDPTNDVRITNKCNALLVIRFYLQYADGTWDQGGEDCRSEGEYMLGYINPASGRYIAHAQRVNHCADEGLLNWPAPPLPKHQY